jgi:hypothetical protein
MVAMSPASWRYRLTLRHFLVSARMSDMDELTARADRVAERLRRPRRLPQAASI